MRSSDLPRVGAMLRECFSPDLRPYLTYAQHGIMTYLEVPLTHPTSFRGNLYSVATDADDMAIGFAEFRLNPANVGFLSYICVADHARGSGVATSLIEHFVLSRGPLKRLELDVFHDNLPAIRLYEKLGFAYSSQQAWLRRPLPPASTALTIPQLPMSTATHAAYGFSELQVEWQGQQVRLGRIGTNILRCFDLWSFNDDDLLARVKATFVSLSEALTILPTTELARLPPETVTVTLGNRMVRTFNDTSNGDVSECADGHAPVSRIALYES